MWNQVEGNKLESAWLSETEQDSVLSTKALLQVEQKLPQRTAFHLFYRMIVKCRVQGLSINI